MQLMFSGSFMVFLALFDIWAENRIFHYSTGVQIVSCTLSSDSVLSDSTGLFNPVLSVSANEIAFDKKLANQSVSFNWC